MRRNWLRGELCDALHAVLCGAGHNLRMILRKLRLLRAWIAAQILVTAGRHADSPNSSRFLATAAWGQERLIAQSH